MESLGIAFFLACWQGISQGVGQRMQKIVNKNIMLKTGCYFLNDLARGRAVFITSALLITKRDCCGEK